MWVSKKRIKDMLARAYSEGFNKGYQTADVHWKNSIRESIDEVQKNLIPNVLLEAEEILREQSNEE